eukprot:CAMPEP_0114659326 /NCGR_PEP_ID=MMETSP0191-20121206/17626_1 /TAXON_ID=126664 /ORGANISM="Sorites sp." /LENGTH=86 /DNA_ID=CAMNT_0001884217 /DNA_START=138 /DNA_END=395 /DNA_ORIENTATION=-
MDDIIGQNSVAMKLNPFINKKIPNSLAKLDQNTTIQEDRVMTPKHDPKTDNDNDLEITEFDLIDTKRVGSIGDMEMYLCGYIRALW